MTPEQGLAAGSNPSWSLNFWNRVHRYRCLFMKFWWVMVFVLSVCLCIAAWSLATKAPVYVSTASLIVENKTIVMDSGHPQDTTYSQALEDMIKTQIQIFQGPSVRARAVDRLMAQYPDEGAAIARDDIKVDFTNQNSILVISASGKNPLNTQRYLEALINGFLDYRRTKREDKMDSELVKVRSESERMAKELQKDDADMIAFQRDNGVVFQNGQNGPGGELGDLRKKLADLHSEYDQLSLATPEQALSNPIPHRTDVAPANGNGSSAQEQSSLESSTASSEYRSAQQTLANYKAELEDLSRDLRDKHPRIIALKASIDRQKKVIDNLIKQNADTIAHRLVAVDSLIKATEQRVHEAESKTLSTDLLRAEYEQKAGKKERDMKNYSDLQIALRNGSISTSVNQEEFNIIEHASVGGLVPSSWLKIIAVAVIGGIAAGAGILLLIDRMDDRMNSISDFQLHFAEHVIGQIPRDAEATENTELLRPDDQRHQLVESFRNLRSTLLFMPLDGVRPKTLLITSAVPNEGKSTISSNLALVLASAGMKTLLIDADLRRGAIHQAFGLSRDPGLTDVLGHSVNWKLAIRESGVDNLHVLPRGRNVLQPSEYLLNRSTDLLLKELYPLYDYIIIDSSPVLAADDTASLAPKIDATLFVVRLSFTSAKMTRKSLEILYKRQANIPGLILNQVDTSSPEFVYYQYSEYYHSTPVDDEPVKTS